MVATRTETDQLVIAGKPLRSRLLLGAVRPARR